MSPPKCLGIVHVVDSLERGGMERVVVDLAIEQRRHGHRPLVFSINETDGFRNELETAGIGVSCGGKRGSFDLRVMRTLRHAARNADIVHTHNYVPAYYAALALAGRRTPMVNTCHNMGSRLSNRRLRLLYRWALTRSGGVAFVGRQVEEKITASGVVGRTFAEVVPNGIPLDHHGRSAAREEARASLALAPETPVIGCVGRLVALKNHASLVALLPQLAAEFPGLKLVIAGDGPLGEALLGQAQALGVHDNLVLLGGRDDIPALLPAFDVFALPSLTEGLSIALLEACAASLAIVAARVGGNPEVIVDDETGRLYASGDDDALLAILRQLLGDPARRRALGGAARRWVVSNGSIEVMRGRYDGFYEGALRRAGGTSPP